MNDIKMRLQKYARKLNKEIIKYYLEGFERSWNGETWTSECQSVLLKFVLCRPGWTQKGPSNDVFVFNNKYPLIINILYSESAGTLLIDTAIGIAKAELMDDYILCANKGVIGDTLIEVVECVSGQDWGLPFIRRTV